MQQIYRRTPMSKCDFNKKETLAQVFLCGFCEIFKNTFFIEHLPWLLLWRNVERVEVVIPKFFWKTDVLKSFAKFPGGRFNFKIVLKLFFEIIAVTKNCFRWNFAIKIQNDYPAEQ